MQTGAWVRTRLTLDVTGSDISEDKSFGNNMAYIPKTVRQCCQHLLTRNPLIFVGKILSKAPVTHAASSKKLQNSKSELVVY